VGSLSKILPVFLGIATYYTGPIGAPLYCDDGTGHLYDVDAAPWVSLSEKLYKTGWAECGDKMKVVFEDGTSLIALAMDAGPLHKYFLEENPGLPLLADVPQHLWPYDTMSAQVKLVNLTAVAREVDRLERLW